jgi:hypothetical protein
MKKFITLATAGCLLFSLQSARAQRQVEPPPVPPMLESGRPLAQPETREPSAPKQSEESKAKPKAKAKTKAKTKTGKTGAHKAATKKASPKQPAKNVKKKGQKNHKKKSPEARVKHRGPVTG